MQELVEAKRERIRQLRRLFNDTPKSDSEGRRKIREQREAVERELLELAFEATEKERLHSQPVLIDSGVADAMISLLSQVRGQIERELERDDLYPNVRNNLYRKGLSLDLVISMFRKGRSIEEIEETPPSYALYAEYDDGSIDLIEADDQEQADEFTERLMNEGALVTRYRVIPEEGTKVMVHEPVTSLTNVYKPVPDHVLRRMLQTVGVDKVKLPPEDQDRIQRLFSRDTPRGDWAEDDLDAE